MKRIPIPWQNKFKDVFKKSVKYFLIIITTLGTIAGLLSWTGNTISLKTVIELVLACVAISVLLGLRKEYQDVFPDEIVDELSSDQHYQCTFCSREQLEKACDMTKPYYKDEYVSSNIAEQWRLVNDKSFVQITNSNNELCACFGILALKSDFFNLFIDGKVQDKQLKSTDILPFKESTKEKRLYISGVIVKDPESTLGKKRAAIMIWSILQYIKAIYGLRRQIELYALAVTKVSERLMINLKFDLVSESSYRTDNHNLYRYSLNRANWNDLINHVGGYSGMCSCNFSL